jgi:adenine deaminase
MAKALEDFIRQMPKAELHLHIEGTLEPELMFEIALRNRIEIRFKSVEELKKAYNFSNLQDFLDIYYEGAGILREEQDFYDVTWAYLRKAHSQHVLHAEIFFDPQTHTGRGIEFSTIIGGISRALKESNEILGMSTRLIMCFLRHLDEESAMKTLDQALIYKELITAVGLDSSEVGNPPSKFERVFDRAIKEGFLTVAHAGEEGPASYVGEALDLLNISRVDHGNNSLDDERIVQELVSRKIPLTVCPLSNLKLKVVQSLNHHPLKEMLNKGLLVTVNSDDPAYFGGYVNENYLEISQALDLSEEEIVKLARNSFLASFMDDETRQKMISRVEKYYQENRE